jgi:hypothetical protein
MFIHSNLIAIKRALSRKFYGVETEPRNATNLLRITNKLGSTDIYLNFGNKATYTEFKNLLLSLPVIQGETAQFSKLQFTEQKTVISENSHRENLVRYYLPTYNEFEQKSSFFTLRFASLRQAKRQAGLLKEILPYVTKIVLIKEALNGLPFQLPTDCKDTIFVFCKLKTRKFAIPRYSIATIRNDEGRIKCIFKRRN